MTSQLQIQAKSLYEQDFNLWIEETVNKLKSCNFNDIDLQNLIEEIESVGRSDKRAICSYLQELCCHLLKIQYWKTQREYCFRGWNLEVYNFRNQIDLILKDSPSLKSYLKDMFLPRYRKAREQFHLESGLNLDAIPEQPPFTLEQALDENWLPWQIEQN